MTLDRTPPNAPVIAAHKPGQCSAYGCPMWAGIKLADDWLCDCHAMSAPQDWQDITQRLNENMRLVRACHWAMKLSGPEQATRAGEYMAKMGRPELAPCVRTLNHAYPDRHTGEMVERTITKDEREYLGLWKQRLRQALFDEATQKSARREARLQVAKQVESWKRGGDLLGGLPHD
ncbi:hypothetical protein [Cupriavidus sp. EM10]|uniref:hypothetical protein n=1 Tax=Cupriavidus sp. EM10 TaxID=2839983 RepID=UPI001C007A43|nr:hypothetical protein [Cupriavidus sp. EM10]QWE95640.1 hypothetical protein KLP38_07315 [Cupriavidus sp. EM10]